MPTKQTQKLKGHWPSGKRRNPSAKAQLAKLKRARSRLGSYAKLGSLLDVNAKTVWRWAKGIDWPSPANARKIDRRLP